MQKNLSRDFMIQKDTTIKKAIHFLVSFLQIFWTKKLKLTKKSTRRLAVYKLLTVHSLSATCGLRSFRNSNQESSNLELKNFVKTYVSLGYRVETIV